MIENTKIHIKKLIIYVYCTLKTHTRQHICPSLSLPFPHKRWWAYLVADADQYHFALFYQNWSDFSQ